MSGHALPRSSAGLGELGGMQQLISPAKVAGALGQNSGYTLDSSEMSRLSPHESHLLPDNLEFLQRESQPWSAFCLALSSVEIEMAQPVSGRPTTGFLPSALRPPSPEQQTPRELEF